MRLALCQMNATVGDIAGNAERIREGRRGAAAAGAELVLFPELALTGYPPEDLLLREDFLTRAAAALQELASEAGGPVAVVGFPERAEDVYNAAAVLAGGRVHAIYRKVYLPNYGVFDEQRYFQAGSAGADIDLGAARVGLTVCEDIWEPGPPASEEALAGAALIVNISASPYHAGKGLERERMFAQRARDNLACVAFCALVGGLDDYVEKNGFRHVVLGLSGGVDSALVACIAADALGPERVSAAVMPSPYSSAETQADAHTLGGRLGLQLFELPIADILEAYKAD